jgi:hypothetical protein
MCVLGRLELRCLNHYWAGQMGRDNTHADPLYEHLIVTVEPKFWRCVESEPPTLPMELKTSAVTTAVVGAVTTARVGP